MSELGHSRPGPTSSRPNPCPLFANRYLGGKALKTDEKGPRRDSYTAT
jgi:hypothetical protein